MTIGVFLRTLFSFLGVLVALYGAVCVFIRGWQTHLMFFPTRAIATTPQDYGLSFQDVWLPVGETSMHGWWLPAPGGEAQDGKARQSSAVQPPVLLYLHGNGSNVGGNLQLAMGFQRMGMAVFLVDYRGYGQSGGPFPNEQRVYEDGEAAWKYLTQVRQIEPRTIRVFGHSLGGAIALELATRHPEMGGVIVQNTFTSMRAMVDEVKHYGWLPVDWVLTQRFDSLAKVRSLQVPLLVIHGQNDELVPFQMGRALYDASPGPKVFMVIPGGEHNNTADVGGALYWRGIRDFVQGPVEPIQPIQPSLQSGTPLF